jgi:hypothetical protein
MTPRIIVGIVALLSVSVCGLLSTFMTFEVVDKVNEKLPETEKFAQLGWYLSKRQRLNREYRRFYPEGRLLLWVRVLMALMFVCLLTAAWSFGVFAK